MQDKTFKIHTLGCKVNQYDSQVIREQLERAGLKEITDDKKADFCIINTCTVTSSADRQSRYLVRLANRQNPNARIIVTGCYAHANADDLKDMKGVDLILNNFKKDKIASHISTGVVDKTKVIGINNFKGHTRAFVKVQDGCNNFCSFCKVPYVRGRSKSRDLPSIIAEIRGLARNGYKEVVLTGICLGDYGKDLDKKIGLVDLINEIEKIRDIYRIRISSIEAKDVSDRLIKKMSSSDKLCPHLHIPFQSGDDHILKQMNRPDTRKNYLRLIEKLRKKVRDFAVSCDIMIGFPGEDEKKFNSTVSLLKKVIPSRAHIFTFNPRDLTKFSGYNSQIPMNVLDERFELLKTISGNLACKFNEQFINKEKIVLFENIKSGLWRGHTDNYLEVITRAKSDLSGELIKVKITQLRDKLLFGELCLVQ